MDERWTGLKELFEKYGVVLAYLFGSQATGQVWPLSDVDIAVLFGNGADGANLPRLNAELMRALKSNDVDLLDLGKATPLLKYVVAQEGRLLFCADEDVRIHFVIEAIRTYEDTKPLRLEGYEGLKERIKRGVFAEPLERRISLLKTEVILERLRSLEEYVSFLKEKSTLSFEEFKRDRTVRLAVERALQLAIQCVIDIATHIMVTMGSRTPTDYGDAILGLAELGVIPPAYAAKIVGMAGFRNVLVHEYLNIDLRQVYKNWQEHLEDFVRFSEYIIRFLEEKRLLSGGNTAIRENSSL